MPLQNERAICRPKIALEAAAISEKNVHLNGRTQDEDEINILKLEYDDTLEEAKRSEKRRIERLRRIEEKKRASGEDYHETDPFFHLMPPVLQAIADTSVYKTYANVFKDVGKNTAMGVLGSVRVALGD